MVRVTVASVTGSAKLIPNGRFVLLENSAHWPQWEEAEKFNQIHLDFLLDQT